MTAAAMGNINRRRNLGYFFDEAVRRVPDKVCIIDLFGGTERSITYRKLDERMNRVAATLSRLGVKSGERVGMVVGNRIEFLEFFFGSMRMGAIPVPINTHLNADTLAYVLSDAQCVTALIDPGSNPNALDIAE
jgi:acyl-CoA synthetase (AMP-forming)/AMP-acid ligase II